MPSCDHAGSVSQLPTGTVTLLFSDVDRSTELVKRLGERYGDVLAEHRRLLRRAFEGHGGIEIDTQGDAFFVAFSSARDSVSAAITGQRALAAHNWGDGVEVRVRMGLHTCEPYRSDESYVGVGVHRAARICTIAHGGQVLLSRSTAGIFDDDEVAGVTVRDLGEQRLKDIDRPERVFQVVAEGLPSGFPAPRTIDQQAPLSGTVTVVMAEGRRMMRLVKELTPEAFGTLLEAYRALFQGVFERMGGREVEVASDTATAAFPTAKQAALAAIAAQRAVAAHEWSHGREVAISVGLHSGEAGVGWAGSAVLRCVELCDAAEGGQIFLSQAARSLLEDADLGEVFVRDLGEQPTRRSDCLVQAYELVYPAGTEGLDQA
jgi:class 3 adenylate cyclase